MLTIFHLAKRYIQEDYILDYCTALWDGAGPLP